MSSVASMSSSNPVLRGISYETYCRVRAETDAVGDRTRLWFDQGRLEIVSRLAPQEGGIPVPHALLHGIEYETYCRVRDETDAVQDRTRLNYRAGVLEVVSPSHRHDSRSRLALILVEALASRFGLRLNPGGSTTLRRSDVAQGVEPDECFWIDERPFRDSAKLDLSVDAPPTLVIECEVTRSVVDRLDTLAALRVPEVWRLRDDVVVLCLRDGRYVESDRSRCFPSVPIEEVADHFRRFAGDLTSWTRVVRDWAERLPDDQDR